MRLLYLLLLLVGCTTVHRPPVIGPEAERARIAKRDIAWFGDTTPIVRFNPPYIYGLWRLEVEACAGRTRDGWPNFYIAPTNPLGGDKLAMYVYPSNSIVFSLGSEVVPWIVRHELLHFVLNGEGGQHPKEWFGDATNPGKCWDFINPRG